MNNIYLTGFMGTGKSSTGREIARRLKWAYSDLDELIEQGEKKYISDIFKEQGEPYFRGLENKFLKEVSLKSNYVVSCGGGIVINPANIKLMKETGIMVCFSANPKVILARTSKFSNRPLLNVPNPEEKISALLVERQKFYEQADIVVDTSELSIAQAAERVLNLLPKHIVGGKK